MKHSLIAILSLIASRTATIESVDAYSSAFHHTYHNGRNAFIRRQSLSSERLYAYQGDAFANNSDPYLNLPKPMNEWGVPPISELPPLGPNEMPVPRTLPNGAKITMLGSGPGDPELLTLAAHRYLTESDPQKTLVIADRLVSEEILNLIKAPTKIARKLPGCADLAQDEIYWWTYQALRQGRHVIRLKIGDPFVFGRGGEEVITFRKFGVEAEVIPGVSAVFSAPLLGSIPVTHRGVANQVVMCTGYGREGTSPDLIQYHKEQTVVFLMAVGRLRELCQRLQDLAGYPADTPVGIVEKAGCPDQRTVTGTIETIADVAQKYEIVPPSTIVVGDSVNVLMPQDDETGEVVTGLIQNATTSVLYA